MHAHRIEVLDRTDDHDVVDVVAHDLQLELVPAAHRLLDEHLADRALAQPDLDLRVQLVARVCEAAAVAAERERRPDDGGCRNAFDLRDVGDDDRLRDAQVAGLDRVLEELPVLGAVDHVELRTDQLDTELVQDPRLRQLACEVESGLATQRRQERVGPLLEVERLEIGAVGKPRVGHDRRRIRVDHDRAVAVLAQHLQRLTARVVEFGRLADHDRPGADQADRLDVCALRHQRFATSSTQCSSSGHASCGPGPASGWNCSERACRSGKSRPSTVSSYSETCVASFARAHGKAVVLTRDEHATVGALEHRVVGPAVPEGKLERLVAGRHREHLVSEADAEHVRPPDEVAHDCGLLLQRRGIAGARREQDAVVARELVRVDVVRVHRDRRTRRGETAQHRPLHAVVDDRDPGPAFLGVPVGLGDGDGFDERPARHRRLRRRRGDCLVDARRAGDDDGLHRAGVA